MTTVAVVKVTFIAASKILEDLTKKSPASDYRFFSHELLFNAIIVLAPTKDQDDLEAFIHRLDIQPSVATLKASSAQESIEQPPAISENRSSLSADRWHAIPNTSAAKDLLEKLQSQEVSAASAAKEIRRLQAGGDAVETIAPHQAQLKAHLQTAFELKMELEELQVKELHARLSRLERQIGQRKELREKIIARRVAELLNPDMSWDTATTAQPALAREPSETSDISQDENVQQQIAKLQAKRAELSTKMGNEHPLIRGLDQQIATLRTALSDESSTPVNVFYLKHAKARAAVDLIQQLYPKKMGAIVADDGTNSVLVRGDENLVQNVEQLIKVLDAEGTSSINLDKNSPEKATTGSPADTSESAQTYRHTDR